MNFTTLSTTALVLFTSMAALAETVPGTDADVHFESANIVGTGRSINIHRVPVYRPGSTTPSYFDASFKLSMDSNGNLIFDSFQQVSSASFNSNENFIPGNYADSSGHKFTVSGGGISNGRLLWNIAGGKDNAFDVSWSTGSAIGNIFIGSLPIAAKLPEGQGYGVVGNSFLGPGAGYDFGRGSIIGISQVGKTLILTNYRNDNDKLTSSITYVLTLVE
jgi:hypothetical protein